MNKYSSFDLAFIGSGISSTFTLYHFLKKMEAEVDTYPTRIAVIEKFDTFHSGIPYGERSGITALLITSLKNFLPEPELSEFIPWLNLNKSWLLKEFKQKGGPLSIKWLQNHKTALDNNQWEDLFIPRRFFGYYIDEKVSDLIKTLETQKKVSITYIHGNAIDMHRDDLIWKIDFKDRPSILATKAILAIGSLPTNYLWKNKKRIKENNFLLLNDPYMPSLSETLMDIKEFVADQPLDQQLNVAIIGANASGLEMLYQLNDHPEIKERIHHFYMLSSQGLLPDSKIDLPKLKQYKTAHLDNLMDTESLKASEIAQAVFKDLDVADKIQLGAASTVDVISQKFGSLLNKLNHEELEKFACYHGNEIGRRQRCAGEHYAAIPKILETKSQFTHLAGRFADLKTTAMGYELIYVDADKCQDSIEQPINLVINCIGGMRLSHPNAPKLLRNLMAKGLISSNKSEIGIQVNDRFEAEENLYIIGPLLAGNIVDQKAVWHVEHCGRIISFSKILSDFLTDTKSKKLVYQLEIIDLDDSEGINTYKNLIKTEWDNNPYYLYEYLSHHKSKNNRLIAFNFKVGSKSMVVMPMVLRQIELAEEPLLDAISPYGYNGPLLKSDTEITILKKFWQEVDKWYQNNNVVSEFIRFHLNGNHEHYTGHCVATLDNIFGPLLNSFEEQWDSFLPKVRNNYRKAAKAHLTIKFYGKEEIEREHIATFYNIYVSTMKRNGASKLLYFSLEHFENLVLNNNDNFSIVFVYKDGVAVSTELIIHLGDCLYAYLGGTLSDYFACRPNDFLRVEVIRWGIDQGKRHYVLGGGITNGDGLYKFKKSLFPNSTDRTFYTGRKIVDHEKYKELCNIAGVPIEALEEESFFPLYRINS